MSQANALQKPTRLAQAQARLESALSKLENAASEAAARAGEAAGPRDLQAEMADLKRHNKILEDTNIRVGERLDAVIARLKSAVDG